MIHVTIFKTNNQITAFELSGHARSGPYGYDLVCAGVSAVSFGAVNAVLQLCDTGLDIDQGAEGGFLHVKIPEHIDDENMKKASLLFAGMVVSLETIARDYGQFIEIHYK